MWYKRLCMNLKMLKIGEQFFRGIHPMEQKINNMLIAAQKSFILREEIFKYTCIYYITILYIFIYVYVYKYIYIEMQETNKFTSFQIF